MSNFVEKIEFIELNMKGSNHTLIFPSNEPIVLGENAEIGLKSYMLWYVFPNIAEKYNNNVVKIKHNGAWMTVKIPDGMYEIDTLGQFLNRKILLGRDTLNLYENEPKSIVNLEVDKSTFHCIVQLENGVEIDFTEGKLHELLGLEQKIYSTSERGKNYINITRNFDKLYIRCNLIDRKHQYELRDVLYSINPIAIPGEAIMAEVDHPVEFYPCKNRVIREINIRLTDATGVEIAYKENVNLKIVFRHNVKIN